MDIFSIPLRHSQRRLPPRLAVSHVGYVAQKTEVVDRGFDTINFSFVLRGSGFYDLDGQRLPIEAPCVFVEFPDQPFHYGPWESTNWEELYLIYEADQRHELERAGLFSTAKPLWFLGDTRRVAELWRELRELLTQSYSPSADRVDRLCELLVIESLLCEGRSERHGPEAKVQNIRHHVEQHYLAQHDFAELSRKQGLSPTHFRRLWNTLVGVPPARYLSELRLRQACRMLVESQRSVAAISAELGFVDPLYFSRKFRAFTGENPTSYRRRYGGREA